ncbi:hypothetical protein T11_9419 [Trichinella zimbabwensis]|uniref:Uncharacterized protein n=1 Tax=Trichinella zimbabwensis TaxID=268475 RepID=A0A0V1GE91_9BILA|nr:hypothetical protein T11_9419 [Trichinella zimbabwensis]
MSVFVRHFLASKCFSEFALLFSENVSYGIIVVRNTEMPASVG